jgi:hypothetical protein
MLLKLIFYGIDTGNRSSRKIARLAAKYVLMGVPHDQGNNASYIDDGQIYNSTKQ